MFDLINVFDIFIPQLLLYPNPQDPLNGDAAITMINDYEKYKNKVKFKIGEGICEKVRE